MVANLFVGLLVFALTRSVAAQCGSSCTFRLCKATTGEVSPVGRPFPLRPPGVPPFGPVICRPGLNVGTVLETGEAIVERGDTLTPISMFSPPGLTKNFSATFLSARRVPTLGKSSIVKRRSNGNQQTFFRDLCIRLPIYKYQLLDNFGDLDAIVDTDRSQTDCVSFKARDVQLLVELSWKSSDDLDLALIQPDGQEISRKSKRSSQGGVFFMDVNRKVCDSTNPVGREIVRYKNQASLMPGEYIVQIRHHENCKKMKTSWNLRVSMNGVQILIRKGASRRRDDALIGVFAFTI